MDKLLEAITFATQKHKDQKRKDGITPYITHLLAVGLIISQYTKDLDLVIAGILHDILEDTHTSQKEIENKFGNKVLKIVIDCSEIDKTKSWEERKKRVLEKIPNLEPDSILVKTADTYHNLYELVVNLKKDGIKYFDNFNANAKTKIAYENKRLELLKKYHSETPLLKSIEECLIYINKEISNIELDS